MRQIIFSLLMLTIFSNSSKAQLQFGLKAGLHSVDLVADGITLPNNAGQPLELKFLDSKYGFHFGIYTRITILGLYIEPAAILNSTSVDYSIEEIEDSGVISAVTNETYHNLDIPVMLGIKGGPLRLFAGPVAHLHIQSSSDLVDFPGYEQRFERAQYGFQAGVGLDLWKIRLEAAYEGNLSKFGDHINIDGQPFSFDKRASRLLFTAGLKL